MESKQHNFHKLASWFENKAVLLLWVSIVIYCSIFIGGAFWKYCHYGYNALDLAIYNQVFYNTSAGDLFSFTIHPHSYLGDHFELFILLLIPVYLIFRHPLTLLILQTLAIALAAWPLYLIAKKYLDKRFAFLIALIFLLNPFVQNLNLFEFHILPFALFFIFFVAYFYSEKKFVPFVIFFLTALLIREDVALVLIMFSVLALIDKKSKKWFFFPLLVSLSWLVLVFFIIPKFSHYDSYKFLFYYSWLGDSLGSILGNAFFHPLRVITHLLSLQNISLILALFLPFLLLPILKPKYMFLSLLVFAQILLGSFSGELVLKTHYSTLLLPALFLSIIMAFAFILNKDGGKQFNWQSKIKKVTSKELPIFLIVLLATTGYAVLTFGPILPLAKNLLNPPNAEYSQLKDYYINLIPEDKAVTTSYDFLPKLSGRENIYSLHYAYIGKKQYSQEDYQLPSTDYLLVDTNDFLIYQVQYPPGSFYQDAYSKGDDRIRSIIKEQGLQLTKASDKILLYHKGNDQILIPYNILNEQPPTQNPTKVKAAPDVNFLGWNYLIASENDNPTFQLPFISLPLSLYWQVQKLPEENLQLLLEVKNKDNQISYSEYYPLGYGIYPTSEWLPEKVIQTNYWFLIPQAKISSDSSVTIQLVHLTKDYQYLGLDGLLSATMKNVEYEPAGEKIAIPLQN